MLLKTDLYNKSTKEMTQSKRSLKTKEIKTIKELKN